MSKPTTISEFYEVSEKYYGQLHRTLVKKQNDYGPGNIANAPGGALNGLRVRIYDKVSRINNLIDSGKEPENESLQDSFLDLANYAIIALMVLNEQWPNPRKWEHE
jgi:hypothetical protein